jgi:hypothetical protein
VANKKVGHSEKRGLIIASATDLCSMKKNARAADMIAEVNINGRLGSFAWDLELQGREKRHPRTSKKQNNNNNKKPLHFEKGRRRHFHGLRVYGFGAAGVAQVVECLPSKYEVWSSNPSNTKKKKKYIYIYIYIYIYTHIYITYICIYLCMYI